MNSIWTKGGKPISKDTAIAVGWDEKKAAAARQADASKTGGKKRRKADGLKTGGKKRRKADGSKTGGNKRRNREKPCPYCTKKLSGLSFHIKQVHPDKIKEENPHLKIIKCPYCRYSKNKINFPGENTCSKCQKTFLLGKRLELLGFCATCRCKNKFYSEKVGELECPKCNKQNWYGANGKVR